MLIYGLHGGDSIIRYVGQTSMSLAQRLAKHNYSAFHKSQSKQYEYPVNRWIRKHGWQNVHAKILEICEDFEQLNLAEVKLISDYRLLGMADLNISDGGMGGPRAWNEASKARASKRLKEFYKTHPGPQLGKHYYWHTDEFKKNMSDRVRGESNNKTKFKEADVIEIRRRRDGGDTLQKIANDFTVSKQTIWRIVQRKVWNHI